MIFGLPLGVVLVAIVSISILVRSSGSIVSSGATTKYLRHVHCGYDPEEQTPLVIGMHARFASGFFGC